MTKSKKKFNKNQGFTLIEVIVVVAIIAILSIIAITLYLNIQKDARNAKRISEIAEIANALEFNKKTTGYSIITASMFGGNVLPGTTGLGSALDPSRYGYCIAYVAVGAPVSTLEPQPTDGSGWVLGGTCPPNYYNIDGSTTPPVNTPAWRVCARMESKTSSVPSVYCKTNVQS